MDRFSALINDIGRLLGVYWESYLSGMGSTLILSVVPTAIGYVTGPG